MSQFPFATVDEIKDEIAIGPFGSRMKADLYVASGVPVVRGNNLTKGKSLTGDYVYVSEETASGLQSCNVKPGDLVFPHRGAIGEVGIIPDSMPRGILSTSLMKLRVNPEVANPAFVFYFFQSADGRAALMENASQVGTPGIATPLRSLRSIRLPLPPLDVQNRVAAILGSLDDKIELNRQMNETLEAMARAIFRSWFVDFDPVRIKARGGDPVAELGLSPEIAALFPSSFQDSELGQIPEGWESKTIGELITFNAKTLGSKDYLEELEYVEISGVSRGNILETTWCKRLEAPSRARRRLKHGDTVLSTVRPDKGAYFLALFPEESLVASTGFAVLTPKLIPWTFLHSAVTQPEAFEYMGRVADGGAYPAISPALIGDFPVCKPAKDYLLDRFHNLTAGKYELSHRLRNESRALAETRDCLLPRLLSGELCVKTAS